MNSDTELQSERLRCARSHIIIQPCIVRELSPIDNTRGQLVVHIFLPMNTARPRTTGWGPFNEESLQKRRCSDAM